MIPPQTLLRRVAKRPADTLQRTTPQRIFRLRSFLWMIRETETGTDTRKKGAETGFGAETGIETGAEKEKGAGTGMASVTGRASPDRHHRAGHHSPLKRSISPRSTLP